LDDLSFSVTIAVEFKNGYHCNGNDIPDPAQFTFKQGETDMGDKGKKDKGRKEQQKKAQLTPKEKRKLKKEKKK